MLKNISISLKLLKKQGFKTVLCLLIKLSILNIFFIRILNKKIDKNLYLKAKNFCFSNHLCCI